MAAFVQTSLSIAIDTLEVAGFADAVNVDADVDVEEQTTFGSGGWKSYVPGLMAANVDVEGFSDFAATGTDISLPVTGFGASRVLTVSAPGVTAADPAFMTQGPGNTLTPWAGAVGKLARFKLGFQSSGKLVRGALLHPQTARTASGSGTAVAFAPPTASQSLFATFHLLAVTGSGTCTFTVQTDDNAGFSSATTRITSTAFTAIGSQMTSLAGALAGETHVRAAWTISGFSSCTFIVAAGVATT
jgi:hypothetical protein